MKRALVLLCVSALAMSEAFAEVYVKDYKSCTPEGARPGDARVHLPHRQRIQLGQCPAELQSSAALVLPAAEDCP